MGRGITVMHIYVTQLKHRNVPIAPFQKQVVISSCLANTLSNVARALDRTSREIDLVRKYRTRLIADVVTGKLDVRGPAAELSEADPAADEDSAYAVQLEADFQTEEHTAQEESR